MTTILDGGMGRELLRIGAPFRQPEWSALALLEAPEFVRQVHDSFVLAGADVITTNTYAVVPYHLGDDRFSARGRELAELAGRLGRDAADAVVAATGRTVSLAGSLPPAFGSYRPDRFHAGDAARILDPLVAGQSPFVDLWLAETQGSTREARAARAAVGAQDERPFWISFTLEDAEPEAVAAGQRSPTLRSGESIAAAAQAALDLQARALLFNCSHAGVMEAAIREAAAAFAERTDRPPAIGVYANAFAPHAHRATGEANEVLDALRDDLDPPEYLAFARRWLEAGASIVGGCCGIGPAHIALLASALREKVRLEG
jgi:S-methylmethionine-dependent homocysteine/selenocysteine methylase